MQVKDYLEQIRWLNGNIRSKLEQREQLCAMIYSMPIHDIKEDYIQQSAEKDHIGSAMAKLVDMEQELSREIELLCDLREQVNRQIDAMKSERYKLLLRLRYLNGYTFEEVADEMSYTYRWTIKMHKEALRQFDEMIRKEDAAVHCNASD
jgi:DNA-directed RNA polymerase specialized sigma subunit